MTCMISDEQLAPTQGNRQKSIQDQIMQIMIGMQLEGAACPSSEVFLFHLHCYLHSCSGDCLPTKKTAKRENDKGSIFIQNVPLTAHTLSLSQPLWIALCSSSLFPFSAKISLHTACLCQSSKCLVENCSQAACKVDLVIVENKER
ncbi:hypothetical protein ILYODFUR_030851 [Ilyodon furcidens]|uniref:Uncharacterized protein n=1 Tax=Ilyodon furcidens TaxID=33524 RepID=A0ABV0UWW9_9TELE